MKRDRMMPTISATGTASSFLRKRSTNVGAQVQGLIKSLGTDPKDKTRTIDYGSEVEPETVLALIDDSVYNAQAFICPGGAWPKPRPTSFNSRPRATKPRPT